VHAAVASAPATHALASLVTPVCDSHATLAERLPEEKLLSSIALHRNKIWSELLDELNRVVRYLREHPEPEKTTFRMADFASFALKVATV
jgi:hypothetical protein